jgi:hypothetical protein
MKVAGNLKLEESVEQELGRSSREKTKGKE